MLTITVSRDGRTWYGRKLYRVRAEKTGGSSLDVSDLTGVNFKEWLMQTIGREVAEGRPFLVIDNRKKKP